MTKARILEAVRDVKGEQSAQLIDHLKKQDMAREAARLLDGSNWLPEPLRMPGQELSAVQEPIGVEAGSSEFPAFLAGDDEGADTVVEAAE